MARRFTVIKYDKGRYRGVSEAARGIGVCKQSLYNYLMGVTFAIGPEKRKKIIIDDRTVVAGV